MFTGTESEPGWWSGIVVRSSQSADNLLDNAVVEFAGGFEGNVQVGDQLRDATLTLTDSTLRHSATAGVWVAADSTVNDDVCEVNTFSDNAGDDCTVK